MGLPWEKDQGTKRQLRHTPGALPGTIMAPNVYDHGTVLFLSTRRC